MKENSTPVDLLETIRQFIAQNRHIFRDCDIRVENPATGPLIYPVIVSLFEMLLMNILTNAMKYNTSGKPRIDITFEQDGQLPADPLPGQRNRHSPSGEESRSSGSSTRAATMTASPSGEAASASISSSRSPGCITGRWSPTAKAMGKGSVFTLILPANDTGGKGGMKQTEKKRILIVEDDAHIAEGLKLNLTLQGYEAAIAGSGTDGLRMWKEWNPHLIVLDIMLPGLDGLSVLRHIRLEDERLPDPDPFRQRGTRRPDQGLFLRRRRLPRQALQPRGIPSQGRTPADQALLEPGTRSPAGEPEDPAEAKKYAFGGNTIDFTTMTADADRERSS